MQTKLLSFSVPFTSPGETSANEHLRSLDTPLYASLEDLTCGLCAVVDGRLSVVHSDPPAFVGAHLRNGLAYSTPGDKRDSFRWMLLFDFDGPIFTRRHSLSIGTAQSAFCLTTVPASPLWFIFGLFVLPLCASFLEFLESHSDTLQLG